MRNLSSACKVILTVTYRNHAFQQFLHYSSYWPSGVVVSAAGVVTGPPSIKSRITWISAAGLLVRSSCLHAWLHFFGNFLRAAKVPNGAKSYLEAVWRIRAILSGGGWNILRLSKCNQRTRMNTHLPTWSLRNLTKAFRCLQWPWVLVSAAGVVTGPPPIKWSMELLHRQMNPKNRNKRII